MGTWKKLGLMVVNQNNFKHRTCIETFQIWLTPMCIMWNKPTPPSGFTSCSMLFSYLGNPLGGVWDFKTLFVIGLEYATFCSHLMPHLVSSKCLPLLFAKMKHFEAALTQFYNWTEQCTYTMGLEFISFSIWILKICFFDHNQINSEFQYDFLVS